MYVKLPIPTTFLLLLCFPGGAWAEEWKSSDGMVSVAAPDPERFVQSKPVPPVMASWESKPGTIKFFITEKAVPPNYKLNPTVLEQMFMHEINSKMKNGKLLDSSTQKHEGYDFFTMTGKGDKEEATRYFTQSITATDKKIYIVAALGIGIDTRTDPDASAFIRSFKAHVPQSQTRTDEDVEAAHIYRTMAIVSGIVLVIAVSLLVVIRVRRGRKSVKTEIRGESNTT